MGEIEWMQNGRLRMESSSNGFSSKDSPKNLLPSSPLVPLPYPPDEAHSLQISNAHYRFSLQVMLEVKARRDVRWTASDASLFCRSTFPGAGLGGDRHVGFASDSPGGVGLGGDLTHRRQNLLVTGLGESASPKWKRTALNWHNPARVLWQNPSARRTKAAMLTLSRARCIVMVSLCQRLF